MPSPIRVVLVDDHLLFRAAMRALFAAHPELELVGEAGEARTAYEVVERTRPDVVLMDLRLAGLDGIAVLREIRRRVPETRAIMLSGFAEVDQVADALAAGAQGYMHKAVSAEECIDGIQRVHRGETYFSPSVPPEALAQHQRLGEHLRDNAYQLLSRREKEVFALLVRGWSNARVAKELSISVKTVESHREHILKKLGLHSIVELVRFAARQNLLD